MQMTILLLAVAMAFPAGAAAGRLLARPQRETPPQGRFGRRDR